MDIIRLRQRFEVLRGIRRTVESVWKEIENYVLPFRGEFFKRDTHEGDVEWRKRWIYDSVPVEAAQTLSASLNGSLTPAMVKWFQMRFRADALNESMEGMEWLEECSNRCWYALQESNFNLEANEAYIDLVGYGNAVVVEELAGSYEDFRGLNFKAIPIKECYFEMGYDGQAKCFYRLLSLTPVQIVDRFGDEVPDKIKELAENPHGIDQKKEVVFAIFERTDILRKVARGQIDLSKPLAPELRPYGFRWFLNETAEELGKEGGYYEMPAYVIRWRKASGSQWGYGPAHIAMGDILTLNQMVYYILTASEKVIDPPSLVEDRGLVSDLDLNAGGMTVIRDINGLKPYESGARFDVSQLQRDDLRNSIRRMFFTDQLELKESPAMTATEVQVRYELMQRMLGPTMGRLQSDFLDPLIQRTFNILYRSGQLPEPPEVILQAGAEMDIEYYGPLARSQKMDEVSALERYVGSVANMAQIYPEVLDLIDPIKAGRLQAELLAVPAKVMRSDKEIQEVQAQRAKAEAEAKAMMEATQGGEAMQSIGKGMEAMKGAGLENLPTAA